MMMQRERERLEGDMDMMIGYNMINDCYVYSLCVAQHTHTVTHTQANKIIQYNTYESSCSHIFLLFKHDFAEGIWLSFLTGFV